MSGTAELQEEIRKLKEQAQKDKEAREAAEKQLAESRATGSQIHGMLKDAVADGYRAGKGNVSTTGSSYIGMGADDGEEAEERPSFLDINNGVDDLSLFTDTARIVHGPKLTPPLCLFNDVFIQYQTRNSLDFLGSVYGKNELTALRKALTPFYELDFFMPLTEAIPAVFKLVNALIRLRVKKDDVELQKHLRGDVQAFVAGVMKRSGGAGNDRVAAAYVILRIREWKEGFEGDCKKGWKVNKLSTFSPDLWKKAMVVAGGSPLLDLRCKDEVDGAVPSIWGAALKIAFTGDATKALNKVRTLVKEHKTIRSNVLGGIQTDNVLPASLRLPSSSSSTTDIPQRDGASGKADSDATGGGGDKGGGKEGGGKGKKPFRCWLCGVKGHGPDSCPKIHSSVTSTGKDKNHRLKAAEPFKEGGPTDFCLNALRNKCQHQKTPSKCKYYHGCALCGVAGHSTFTCKDRHTEPGDGE
jgi:hypothetical protein